VLAAGCGGVGDVSRLERSMPMGYSGPAEASETRQRQQETCCRLKWGLRVTCSKRWRCLPAAAAHIEGIPCRCSRKKSAQCMRTELWGAELGEAAEEAAEAECAHQARDLHACSSHSD